MQWIDGVMYAIPGLYAAGAVTGGINVSVKRTQKGNTTLMSK